MSDVEPTSPDIEAAEYVLGATTVAERAEAERRMDAEPAFAALVSAWYERLTPLIEALPETTPPRVVWMRVAAQLGRATPAVSVARPGLWSDINVWRTATGVFAVAAAATMAILLVYPKTPVAVQAPSTPTAELTPMSVGLLKGEEGPASFVVTLDRANKRLMIAPVSGVSAASDHSFEMWVLPKGTDGNAAAPISLGVMDGADVVVIDTDKLIGPDGSHATLAVSVEPMGGSPTGLPTGPVVASGQLEPV